MENNRTAVVTGVGGQDGYYLTHYLLQLGYRVIGVRRRTSTSNVNRLRTVMGSPNFHLIDGDVTDISSIQNIVRLFKPDEFYHLAAQSHVALSWKYPLATADITGLGTLNCLEAIRQEKLDCKFYFAGSSEQFGNTGSLKVDGPITTWDHRVLHEESPMVPESPYAAAKVFGYNITQVYRRSFGMFASVGILFNHESPLRGEEFVTRKITSQLARVAWGLQEYVELGNMTACRDWGFAGDYVKAMHLILQQDKPNDFVIATGETHSVQEFFEACCAHFALNPNKVYKINPDLIRPKDVQLLLGDPWKAKNLLGWTPQCTFDQLVKNMCTYDYYLQSPHDSDRKRADEFIL